MPELLHPGVYVLEIPSGVRPIEGVSTSTAGFVGVTDKGPRPGTVLPTGRMAEPAMVTSFTDYLRTFGGFRPDSFLTYAVMAFFDNGGRRLYIARVAGAGVKFSTSAGVIKLSALSEGKWGDKITVAITNSSDGNTAKNFSLVISYNGIPVETFDNLTFQGSDTLDATSATPAEYARTAVNSRSEYVAITADITARPANTPVGPPAVPISLAGGDNGGAVGSPELLGSAAPDNTVTGTGLRAFDKITDVNIIAIPGQGDPLVVNAGMAYCKTTRKLQDCFFIGDMGTLAVPSRAQRRRPTDRAARSQMPAISPRLASEASRWTRQSATLARSIIHGSGRPTRSASGVTRASCLPPSGFMAGLYARIDNSRGVFKAPAGTEAGVAGALAPATTVSDAEQDLLNPVKVNVIRTVPGSGWSLGHPHHRQRPRVAVYPGAAHGDLPARQHLLRHPVGGVRAERRAALGQPAAQHPLLHADPVPRRRVPGAHARRRLLRQAATATRRPRPTSTTAWSTSWSASRR